MVREGGGRGEGGKVVREGGRKGEWEIDCFFITF